ncbi:signal transduction histidine kinase [Nitrobacteraceae bacterium AZCC 2146]
MTGRSSAKSLRSRLVWRLVPLQAAMLAAVVLLVVGTLWASGLLLDQRDEDYVSDVLRDAIARDATGRIVLRPTSDLQKLRADVPDLWFSIRDRTGHSLSEGAVPEPFAQIGGALDQIGQARLGWQLLEGDPRRPAARMKWVKTAVGDAQIITATQGEISTARAALATTLVLFGFVLPSLLLMTLATFIATPIVVRGALAGLSNAAEEARQIDIDSRGARLPVDKVPTEVAPLVRAINDALARLDQGYERHKRFLADAAHELRTPIAILNTRLESLPDGPEKMRLLEDVARLAMLAEQLLDLQRLGQGPTAFSRVDLVAVGRSVVADLAPLAIAAGYDISFEAEADYVMVMGDEASLGRAVTNLVQNAIQHGGRHGVITIGVHADGAIEVEDQGPGIPADQREKIFEPFHRMQPASRGAGLGLNLVREIVRLHNGHVVVLDGIGSGACVRIRLPLLHAN